MATHSSNLAQRIPWTEEPGRLQSICSQELDMTEATACTRECMYTHTHTYVCMDLFIYFVVFSHRVVYFVVFQSQSHVQLFETSLTIACQALLSMRFPRQEYQSGLPSPSLGDLTNLGIKPESPALAGRFFTTSATIWHLINTSSTLRTKSKRIT